MITGHGVQPRYVIRKTVDGILHGVQHSMVLREANLFPVRCTVEISHVDHTVALKSKERLLLAVTRNAGLSNTGPERQTSAL